MKNLFLLTFLVCLMASPLAAQTYAPMTHDDSLRAEWLLTPKTVYCIDTDGDSILDTVSDDVKMCEHAESQQLDCAAARIQEGVAYEFMFKKRTYIIQGSKRIFHKRDSQVGKSGRSAGSHISGRGVPPPRWQHPVTPPHDRVQE